MQEILFPEEKESPACRQYKSISPLIISASRATDIPAFYPDWFFHRMSEDYCIKFNPYTHRPVYVDLRGVRFIVFWTKDPSPMAGRLGTLDEKGIGYYFQYTLNDYEREGLEMNVPPLEKRIGDFVDLSLRAGKERVVWRFDPLILSDTLGVDDLLARIGAIGDEIHPHTEKLVFSFFDLYKSVKTNLARSGHSSLREFSPEEMILFSEELVKMTRRWGISCATCAEEIDLSRLGIEKNRCIDPALISRICRDSPEMLHYVSKNGGKDPGQRKLCGCMKSIDIGQYGTCMHLCAYCYANRNPVSVRNNYDSHRSHPLGVTLTGEMVGGCWDLEDE